MSTKSQPQRVEFANEFFVLVDGELVSQPYPHGWAPFSDSFEPIKTRIAQSINKILGDKS